MKTRMRFISCLLALVIITTGAAWAQEKPASPTNKATAGLASSEADQFMSVLDWSQVKFDKVFTYADFDRYNRFNLDLGAAFKAGNLYIGSWYSGTLGNLTSTKENNVKTELTESGGTITNKKETKEGKVQKDYYFDHKAVVLFGFGNIGINLGYVGKDQNNYGTYKYGSGDTYTLDKNSVITNTNSLSTTETKYDPNGFVKDAKHTPFIGFGMNIALGKLTLSPTASFKVTIDETSKKANKTEIQKHATYNSTTKQANAQSDAKVGINGKFGVDLGLGDSVNSSFNLGYDFTVDVYDKTYTDISGAKHKIKGKYKIKTDEIKDEYNVSSSGNHTVTSTFQPQITKKSYFENTLSMGYKMQKDFDRLSLFAGVEAPITFSLDTEAEQTNKTVITKLTHIDPSNNHNDYEQEEKTIAPIQTQKITEIDVKPALKLGLSYAAIPSKLFLNFGAKANIFGKTGYSTKITQVSYNTHVTTTDITRTYKDGRVTKNTSASAGTAKEASSTTTTKYGFANVEANIGLRWLIVENVAFDASYSIIYDLRTYDRGYLTLACTIKF